MHGHAAESADGVCVCLKYAQTAWMDSPAYSAYPEPRRARSPGGDDGFRAQPQRFSAPFAGGEGVMLEPAFADQQHFNKVPAGGLNRLRTKEVLDSMSGAAGYVNQGAPHDEIPRVTVNGGHVEGLASLGLVLMQAKGQVPVVADLTPKGLEMSDVAKFVRAGDRIVEVGSQSIVWSMPVADVEKLLVGATGSACKVRLLRPFPISDGRAPPSRVAIHFLMGKHPLLLLPLRFFLVADVCIYTYSHVQ